LPFWPETLSLLPFVPEHAPPPGAKDTSVGLKTSVVYVIGAAWVAPANPKLMTAVTRAVFVHLKSFITRRLLSGGKLPAELSNIDATPSVEPNLHFSGFFRRVAFRRADSV
jgi:hypothetical protein